MESGIPLFGLLFLTSSYHQNQYDMPMLDEWISLDWLDKSTAGPRTDRDAGDDQHLLPKQVYTELVFPLISSSFPSSGLEWIVCCFIVGFNCRQIRKLQLFPLVPLFLVFFIGSIAETP
jgi:hypothetical protein